MKIDTEQSIRLIIPLFLLTKLKRHPLTSGLYPLSLGRSVDQMSLHLSQKNAAHYTLIYSPSSQGILDYKNQQREIKQGDLVILSPNQPFKFSSIENKRKSPENVIYWINFTGKLADDFAERLLMKMKNGIANVGSLGEIIRDFDTILALGQRGYTATNVIHGIHLLQQVLSSLALQLRLTTFNQNSHFDLKAIETLMQENMHHELNLDTLAHYCQLSKFHFSKKFKELTDTSPIQYFINMKIQKACYQLDNSQDSIKQIAESLGYSDPYYFSRLFKKVVGVSPKNYRK
ncbi:AraC family transcriptional regulator [Colwellia sp. 1_MG-2023]|uniref:AraC family transcriptional regulator n=1 Tax=Colwellia sp. 1_MG-2023 TaxID=3062649 RepID=UPI0026E2978B|nr:AraC family transcriptional regulator [Colwellia sp. 1_MG-2023]MDO6445997.1 AraC family transcriptional regulator [Colwellia sp. 1_MG-2023]